MNNENYHIQLTARKLTPFINGIPNVDSYRAFVNNYNYCRFGSGTHGVIKH